MAGYALFASSHYYPEGGWRDFIALFETVEAAEDAGRALSTSYDWFHVVDLSAAEIVADWWRAGVGAWKSERGGLDPESTQADE